MLWTDQNPDLVSGFVPNLFRSLCELLNAELFVKVGSDQKVVDPGPEPDERVRDADHHHLRLRVVLITLRAVGPSGREVTHPDQTAPLTPNQILV